MRKLNLEFKKHKSSSELLLARINSLMAHSYSKIKTSDVEKLQALAVAEFIKKYNSNEEFKVQLKEIGYSLQDLKACFKRFYDRFYCALKDPERLCRINSFISDKNESFLKEKDKKFNWKKHKDRVKK